MLPPPCPLHRGSRKKKFLASIVFPLHLYRVKHILTHCLVMRYTRARPYSEGTIRQLLSSENGYTLIPYGRRQAREKGKQNKTKNLYRKEMSM